MVAHRKEIELTRDEAAAALAGGKAAGAYLEELGRTDLGQLSRVEWAEFCGGLPAVTSRSCSGRRTRRSRSEMLAQPSPYALVAGRLRDMGYHAMPAKPGEKVPGHFEAGRWSYMARWQDWCGRMPPEFLHERWESWPDAGVCIAHGAVVGADVDTDRTDIAAAVVAALGPSPVRRRGQKGWMGYYRPGSGCEALGARLRWYHPEVFSTGEDGRKSWPPLVELLLEGTQSVVPPTIHPDTGQPYRWLTPDTLEDTPLGDLPELPADPAARLDAELGRLGLTRENPNGRARAAGTRELPRPARTTWRSPGSAR